MNNSTSKKKSIPPVFLVLIVLVALSFVFFLVALILFNTHGESDDNKHSKSEDTVAESSKEDTTQEDTTVAEENTSEEAAPALPDYKQPYFTILKEKQAAIGQYDWQYGYDYDDWGTFPAKENTPIALTDINEDGIPEMILQYCEDENKTFSTLDIYSIDANGAATCIFNSGWDALVAGGSGYYLFTTADNPHLFAFNSMADELEEGSFYEFIPAADGTLQQQEILSYSEEFTDDSYDVSRSYFKNGAPCDQTEYDSTVNNMLNNMTHFVMYNVNYRTEDTISSILSHSSLESMTYGQAYRALGVPDSPAEQTLPLSEDIEFTFSSGAGAWSTGLTLHPDGTFSGSFHDSDMGSSGDGYDATVYVCEFDGKFTNIRKTDDNTYTMTLEYCNTAKTPEATWIEDRTKYVASTPYGIEGGTNFTLYLPGTPVITLPQEYVSWIYDLDKNTTLSGYGLYNVEQQEGFSSY